MASSYSFKASAGEDGRWLLPAKIMKMGLLYTSAWLWLAAAATPLLSCMNSAKAAKYACPRCSSVAAAGNLCAGSSQYRPHSKRTARFSVRARARACVCNKDTVHVFVRMVNQATGTALNAVRQRGI